MKSPIIIATLLVVLGPAIAFLSPIDAHTDVFGPRLPPAWGFKKSDAFGPTAAASIVSLNREHVTQHRFLAAPGRDAGLTTRGGTPSQANPKHYNLTVWEPEKPTSTRFLGEVVTDLDIVQDTSTLFFHAENITFRTWSVRILFHNGSEITRAGPDGVRLVRPNDEKSSNVTLHLGLSIPAGSSVQTSITYDGAVWPRNEELGLFESLIEPDSSNTSKYYSTHSEEKGARRILPCLDDPHWKSNFTVALVVKSHHVATSNMQAISEAIIAGGSKKKVAFETSPPMSTYILTLGMGDLGFHEEADEFRLPLRAYVPKWVSTNLTDYPLRITARGLAFFEDILGIEVPLQKVDWWSIGLQWGAMENWGMVVVGLENFAMDLGLYDVAQAQLNAWLFLHELAHFWFGDLVTCDWWTDIWLNEGFATYFSYVAIENFFPRVDVATYQIFDARERGMSADLGSSSHALEIPFDYRGQRFDNISYLKGSSMLRMISAYIGETALISHVRKYLAKHRFGTAKTKDFFVSLGDSGWDLWKPWVQIAGHPYLLVNETEEGDIHLTQVHRVGDLKADSTFPIPLLVKTDKGVDRAALMIGETQELQLDTGNSDFFSFNAEGAGFYRVGYTSDRLQKLVNQSHKLTTADLTALILDSYTICTEGMQLSAGDVLGLVSGLMDRNDDYWVWSVGYGTLKAFRDAWSTDADVVDAIDGLVRSKTAARVRRMGWAATGYWDEARKHVDISDDDLSVRFRAMTLYESALAGEQTAVEAAREITRTLFKDGMAAAGGNAWRPALGVSISHGGENEWNSLLRLFDSIPNYKGEKAGLGQALGHTTIPTLIQDTMAVLQRPNISALDQYHMVAGSILRGIGSNPVAVPIASAWTRDHWNTSSNSYSVPEGMIPELGTMVYTSLASQARTSDEVLRWRSWLETTDVPELLVSAIEAALDGAVKQINWVDRNRGVVRQALGLYGTR